MHKKFQDRQGSPAEKISLKIRETLTYFGTSSLISGIIPSMRTIIKLGDVFEIPLSDGRKAYGQYVYDNMGSIIRVFNYFTATNEEPELNRIDSSKLLFPPIHAFIHYTVKNKKWKIIGKLPSDDYIFKGFIGYGEALPLPTKKNEPVRIHHWALWDGRKSILIGEKLPKEYQNYETTAIYPPDLVIQRIETGFDSFEYPKKYNRFLTKEERVKKLKSN